MCASPNTDPASIDSNDGAASFSSSLIAKNCAGANGACSGALKSGVPLSDAVSSNRRAPATGAPPKIVDVARRVERHDLLASQQLTEWIEHDRRAGRGRAAGCATPRRGSAWRFAACSSSQATRAPA